MAGNFKHTLYARVVVEGVIGRYSPHVLEYSSDGEYDVAVREMQRDVSEGIGIDALLAIAVQDNLGAEAGLLPGKSWLTAN